HGRQQREARAGTDIRAQADMDRATRIARRTQRKQAATEKQVRCRAMRERGAVCVAALEGAFVQPYAVRKHCATPGEAVMGIDVEIVAPLREQLHRPGDLGVVFGDVGLYERVGVLAPQAARKLQLLRGAASGETRRDGVKATAAAVPLFDQRLRLL